MSILTFDIISNSTEPLYQQLYNYIKNEILSGKYKYNSKLPSKRKLSIHLQISLNTIEAAYQQLIAEGYVESIPKKGYYVCKLDDIIQVPNVKRKETEPTTKNKNLYKYDFSTSGVDLNSFPYNTWRKLLKDTFVIENKELLQLGDPQGDIYLREAIANYLHHSRGVNCTTDQIIIGAGTDFLLHLLIQILGNNNVYAIEDPMYNKAYRIFESLGNSVNLIPMNRYGIDIESLKQSNSNIAYITPSHQFPLGIIMPISRRMKLLNWADGADNRYIIEDDYDSEFRYSGKPIPALQGLDMNDKVIYLGSFSKSLSPSIRISYMVLPSNLLKTYKENFNYYASSVPRVDQKILHRFITEGYFERHLNKMRNIYKKKREKLINTLKIFPENIEIIGENAGLHILLRPNNNMTETDLIESAHQKGIKVYPLSNYYFNKTQNKHTPTILLGYANISEQDIEKGINLLYEAWYK